MFSLPEETAPREAQIIYDSTFKNKFWEQKRVFSERDCTELDLQFCFEGLLSKSLTLTVGCLRHVTITNSRKLFISKEKLTPKLLQTSINQTKHVALLNLSFSPISFNEDNKVYKITLFRGTCEQSLYVRTFSVVENLREALERFCPKTCFGDFYEKREKIGQGAYSNVFIVKRKKDDKQLAGKYIKMEKVVGIEKIQESLRNEIGILTSIKHNLIPKIKDVVIEQNGQIIIIMSLIKGQNLFEYIKTTHPKRIEETVTIFKGLIDVVKYLHKNKIIHRDIKPENIILRNDDIRQPVLIDYGFAVWEHEVLESIRCGTPGYLAPEIFNPHCFFSFKSDIFSLGVTMFMVFTDYFPFPGKNNEEILKRNKKRRIHFKSEQWEAVHPVSKHQKLQKNVIVILANSSKFALKHDGE